MYTDGSVLGCWEYKFVAWETGVVFKEEIEEPQTTQESPPRHDVPSIGTEIRTVGSLDVWTSVVDTYVCMYVHINMHKSCPDVRRNVSILALSRFFFF